MRTIEAEQFYEGFFELLDKIAETGEGIIITKHGKPLVTVSPVQEKRHLFGIAKGTARILGDIESPVLPPIDEWSCDELGLAEVIPANRRS